MDDWLTEAAKMCTVYRNATLTITAAGASSAEVGCFPRRNLETYEISTLLDMPLDETIFVRRALKDTHTLLFATDRDMCDFTDEELSSCPIITRGWILQERLLSRRILYCGQEELIWECFDRTTCECTHGDWSHDAQIGVSLAKLKLELHNLDHGLGDSNGPIHPIRRWTQIVRIYSSLLFTVATDRLAAISGIARAFEKPENGKYYAGMWVKDIAFQLAWRRVLSVETLEPAAITEARIRGPSWSWASITGPIDYLLGINFSNHRPTIDIQEITTELVGRDPMGAVNGGRIVASAPAVEGIVRLVPTKEEARKVLDMLVEIDDFRIRAVSDVRQWEKGTDKWQRTEPTHRLEDGEKVLCVQLLHAVDMDRAWCYNSWLVLQRVSERVEEWRRIGLIHLPEHRTWKSYAQTQPHRDVLEDRATSRNVMLV